jgi:hypothetical protein
LFATCQAGGRHRSFRPEMAKSMPSPIRLNILLFPHSLSVLDTQRTGRSRDSASPTHDKECNKPGTFPESTTSRPSSSSLMIGVWYYGFLLSFLADVTSRSTISSSKHADASKMPASPSKTRPKQRIMLTFVQSS